jgi:Flp pilus assembly protein TadG
MTAPQRPLNLDQTNKPIAIASCQNGTALLEFAITLPVLLMLYLGCVQICDAVAVYRKTTTTTRTIVDLTSQQTQVSDSELDSIMSASSQVMAPYATTGVQMVLTQVTISSTGVATVDWSRGSGGGTENTVGSVYTLPSGVAINGTSIIIGKVNYDYVANLGGIIRTEIPLGDTIYMYPRSIARIPKV